MTDDTPPNYVPSTAPSGSIPAERARIEPSPPSKRLDALPVLYLVGFVILAASLIYLWKHPVLPRGAALEVARMDTLREQINAIQGRVDKLETRPAPAVPDVAPLAARLAELEHRPVPAMPEIQSIETRLAALESRPPPITDLRPIEARLGALEGKPPVDLKPLEARLACARGQAAGRSEAARHAAGDPGSQAAGRSGPAAVADRRGVPEIRRRRSGTRQAARRRRRAGEANGGKPGRHQRQAGRHYVQACLGRAKGGARRAPAIGQRGSGGGSAFGRDPGRSAGARTVRA